MARRRRVGADQRKAHVGPVAVGDPRLLAVDAPSSVGLLRAAAAHAGNVAAGVGLAEQLAPDMLAAPDRWQAAFASARRIRSATAHGQPGLPGRPAVGRGRAESLRSRSGRAAGGDRRGPRVRPASRHRRTRHRTIRRTICAAGLPVRRSPGARCPSRASIGGACSAMCALTRFRNSVKFGLVGSGREALTNRLPPPIARDSTAPCRADEPLVKTRRSS